MTYNIVNAAPMVRPFNTDDESIVEVPRVPLALPQHLPMVYLFAERGPTEVTMVGGTEAERIFGKKTFDLRGKYANHSTVFCKAFIERANIIGIKRLIPEDAGPKSNLTLWLDVLPATIDTYVRNTDGSIKTDALGQAIVSGSTQGYRVKWVVTNAMSHAEAQKFGTRTITVGDQVDSVTNTQSQRYPVAEWAVDSQGSYGDSLGLRIWASTAVNSRMPTKLMNNEFAYPFNIAVIEKPDRISSPVVRTTLFGEQNVTFTLKPGAVDPSTKKLTYLDDIFVSAYENKTDVRYPEVNAPFSTFKLYDRNINELLTLFHAAEAPFVDALSDFTADTEQRYLFNLISGVDSNNRPYHSFVFSDDTNSVRLTQFTNIYAAGGSDGTMTVETFATLVGNDVKRFADEYEPYSDIGSLPVSVLYDSGFPLETKLDLVPFIALRPDTFVHLGTYEAGSPALSASEEHSVAVALRTRLRSFPESEYFGTPTVRGMITGYSGRIRNSTYLGRLPLTYEVAIKSAEYMGAANGRWKSEKRFQGQPGSIVSEMFDISITWVPGPVRNRNWDVSLNWVQRSDHKTIYFPAFKTIYDNDTSVLTSYTMAMAICYINKVAYWTHAKYSGRDDLSDLALCDEVNNYARSLLNGKFDGRYIIEPLATVTEMDALRGFSFTLPFRVYGNNAKTLMTSYVQTYRMSALATMFGSPVSATVGG